MTMRSTPVWLGVLSLLAVLASCTNDNPAIVYIGMAYQVRCLDCQPRETDPSPRDIRAVDGEAGYSLKCAVSGSGKTRRVTFSAEHQSTDASRKYVLSVKNAPLAGEETAGACSVRVIEGGTTFVAACGSDAPSSDQPCQISLKERNGVIQGGLYCDKMPTDSSLVYVRYLVAPYTSEDAADFELYGCSGLAD